MSASATAPPATAPRDIAPFPAIPYGRGNFRSIRLDGCLYVDKTRFTEDEVRGMIENYRNLGVFDQDPEAALATMREWYDGYRFAKAAPNVAYNTDMVLYLTDRRLARRHPEAEFKGLALVYCGWELLHAAEAG